ncbi:MAG TPA: hypothetical protein VL096_11440 [Pirellulaceae bacterium]|nr:hypothetical protein [Pirellulaceae bacterium]
MSIGFERIIKQIPKDRLPADKETLAFFTSEDIDRGCLMIHANLWSGDDLKRQTKISILAPTAELAEKRAAMLLELLDQGYFRAIQKVSLKHHTTAAEDWRKYRTTQQEEEAQSLELKQQLAEYADFPAELLADARALQLQADIALADAKARTTTCDALLTSNEPLSQALRDKVHVLKLEIKVELAGIEARQAKSAEYVSKVTTAIQLAKKSETLALKRRQTNGSLNSLAKMLHELDAAIQVYEPMPLVDVKVVVQPVEWVP